MLVLLAVLAASGFADAQNHATGHDEATVAFEADAAGAYAEARALLAQAQPATPPDGTGYGKLKAYFEAGTQPDPSDLKGWLAGRWFEPGKSNEPHGALLVGEEVEEIPGGGPAFGRTLKAVLFFHYEARFYDAPEPNLLRQITMDFERKHPGVSVLEFKAKGASFVSERSMFELRKYGKFLVAKEEEKQGGTYYWYFYLDVTPEDRRPPSYLPSEGRP